MNGRLPSLSPQAVIKALERAGFAVDHVSGSHHILRSKGQPQRRVTVPFHRRDLPRGTLRAIIREAGLSRDEFLELL